MDKMTLAIGQGRETAAGAEPVERQLTLLAERCAEILNRWSDVDQRHARAITGIEARLAEWNAIEGRLEQSSLQRMHDLEQLVEDEWKTLRQMHEEPLKRLREQSAALGEVCAKAAHLALQGFERAEARFAGLERDVQAQLGELSRNLQMVLAELRREGGRPAAAGADVAPFPIEGIMRIHEELREGSGPAPDMSIARLDGVPASGAGLAVPPQPVRQLPEATALSDRIGALEREVTSEREEVRETATRADQMRRNWRLALGVLGAAVIIVGFLGWRLQQRVSARLDDAATRAAAAERQAATVADAANRQIASVRADADRQIAQARDAASKAEIVASVLAATDLVRFNLVGNDQAASASAQALWSRSRGFVLSAVRLPVAAAGSTYQVWLSNDAASISAGTFVTDSSGRVTLAADNVQNAPRPVTGITVTLEPAGGRPAPTGPTVLARAQQ